jgi:hypothetical protein
VSRDTLSIYVAGREFLTHFDEVLNLLSKELCQTHILGKKIPR